MDKLFRRSPIDLPIETNRSRGRAQVVYRSLKPVVTRLQGDGCDGVDTESCSLSPASISSLSFSTRVGGCAVVSQPPLSFISACTRVVSSPLVLHPSPYFLPLRMNTKQGFEWTKGTREREREAGDTRVPTESVPVGIPWPPSSQEQAHATRDTRSIRWGSWRTPTTTTTGPSFLSTLDTLPLARVRGGLLLRTRVCPFKPTPRARVPRDARGFIALSDAGKLRNEEELVDGGCSIDVPFCSLLM